MVLCGIFFPLLLHSFTLHWIFYFGKFFVLSKIVRISFVISGL